MSVHFKFKSAKSYDTVTFGGTAIKVYDLKKAIVEKKQLNKGLDFDLVITDAQTGQAYEDENFLLPKNTSVLVKRVPVAKTGLLARMKQEYQNAVPTVQIGQQSQGLKSESQLSSPSRPGAQEGTAKGTPAGSPARPGAPLAFTMPEGQDVGVMEQLGEGEESLAKGENGVDEVALLDEINNRAAEFRNQRFKRPGGNMTWSAGSGPSGMVGAPGGQNGPGRGRGAFPGRGPYGPGRGMYGRTGPSLTPPEGYICHRCGQPGHWINQCPTNGDPKYDTHKVRKRTGIPTTFLQTVTEEEAARLGDGRTIVTAPGGGLAVVAVKTQDFEKAVQKGGGSATVDELRKNPPPHLSCLICSLLIQDAVLVPCCHESTCDGCIRSALIDSNMQCPLCGTQEVSPDKLLPNKQLRVSVEDYLQRTRNEQADKERIAREAEKLLKEKEKKKEEEQRDERDQRATIQGRADAVLALGKSKGDKKKGDDDDDDELGGDIFDSADKGQEEDEEEEAEGVKLEEGKDEASAIGNEEGEVADEKSGEKVKAKEEAPAPEKKVASPSKATDTRVREGTVQDKASVLHEEEEGIMDHGFRGPPERGPGGGIGVMPFPPPPRARLPAGPRGPWGPPGAPPHPVWGPPVVPGAFPGPPGWFEPQSGNWPGAPGRGRGPVRDRGGGGRGGRGGGRGPRGPGHWGPSPPGMPWVGGPNMQPGPRGPSGWFDGPPPPWFGGPPPMFGPDGVPMMPPMVGPGPALARGRKREREGDWRREKDFRSGSISESDRGDGEGTGEEGYEGRPGTRGRSRSRSPLRQGQRSPRFRGRGGRQRAPGRGRSRSRSGSRDRSKRRDEPVTVSRVSKERVKAPKDGQPSSLPEGSGSGEMSRGGEAGKEQEGGGAPQSLGSDIKFAALPMDFGEEEFEDRWTGQVEEGDDAEYSADVRVSRRTEGREKWPSERSGRRRDESKGSNKDSSVSSRSRRSSSPGRHRDSRRTSERTENGVDLDGRGRTPRGSPRDLGRLSTDHSKERPSGRDRRKESRERDRVVLKEAGREEAGSRSQKERRGRSRERLSHDLKRKPSSSSHEPRPTRPSSTSKLATARGPDDRREREDSSRGLGRRERHEKESSSKSSQPDKEKERLKNRQVSLELVSDRESSRKRSVLDRLGPSPGEEEAKKRHRR